MLLSFSKVLTLISTLLCNKFLVLMLNKTDVGTYQQIYTIVSFTAFVLLGLPEAITYFFSGNLSKKYPGIKKVIYLLIAISAIASVGIIVMGNDLIARFFGNDQLTLYTCQLSVLFATTLVTDCFPHICIATDKLKSSVVITMASAVLRLVCFIYGYMQSIDLNMLLVLTSAISIIIMIAQIICVFHGECYQKEQFNLRKNLYLVFAYAFPLFITSIIGKLTSLTDKLMIGYFYSADVYASYSVAARELPYTIITSSFIAVATPIIFRYAAEKRLDDAVSLWKSGVKYSAIFIVFVIASNIVVADDLIELLYSKEYVSMAPIFIVYLFALLPRIAYWGIFAKAMNLSKYILGVSIFELINNAVMNLVFIKMFGLIGPAIATVVASFISVILWIFVNKKLTGKRFVEMFPVKDFSKAVLVNLVLMVFFVYIKIMVIDPYVNSVLLRLSIIAVSWGGIELFIYYREVKEMLRGYIKGGDKR